MFIETEKNVESEKRNLGKQMLQKKGTKHDTRTCATGRGPVHLRKGTAELQE
jgi:hypothetical protein